MGDVDDWRLQGQEKFLAGKTLHRRKWSRPADNPGWDHDHCVFCWQKFSDIPGADTSREGFCTADGYHWVCETCFNDFRERLKLTNAGDAGTGG